MWSLTKLFFLSLILIVLFFSVLDCAGAVPRSPRRRLRRPQGHRRAQGVLQRLRRRGELTIVVALPTTNQHRVAPPTPASFFSFLRFFCFFSFYLTHLLSPPPEKTGRGGGRETIEKKKKKTNKCFTSPIPPHEHLLTRIVLPPIFFPLPFLVKTTGG